MLNKCPKKCEKCGSKEFKDLPSCWKCKDCGKNYGKTIARIISKTMPIPLGSTKEEIERMWFTKKEADRIENVRPDLKTAKIIDRKKKKSYTELLEEDGTSKIIQERDL